VVRYGISTSFLYPGSFFLFGDSSKIEKRFTYKNGNVFHLKGVVFSNDERDYIVNYFKKYEDRIYNDNA